MEKTVCDLCERDIDVKEPETTWYEIKVFQKNRSIMNGMYEVKKDACSNCWEIIKSVSGSVEFFRGKWGKK